MRQVQWFGFFSLVGILVTCTKEQAGGYLAPRHPEESVLSWADAYSSGLSTCQLGDLECNSSYLGTKEHWEGLPVRAAVLYDYVALLDFDYDIKDKVVAAGFDEGFPRLKVKEVVEEYINLLPDKKWDEIVVHGTCDEKGHCMMLEGNYPMPLWSGTSVVFGRVWCPVLPTPSTEGDPRVIVYLSEVYAVEKDTLYDFFGFGYNWLEMREMLKEAGKKAMETRKEACFCQKFLDNPPPECVAPQPAPDKTGSDGPTNIQPQPLPEQ